MTLAEEYKQERIKRGKQKTVAKLLKVRPATISERETNKRAISEEAMLALKSLPVGLENSD